MAKVEKKTISQVHYQVRGWGGEYWIENLSDYCGKILKLQEGKCGSLHFHKNKLETMLLYSGSVKLRMIDTDTGKEYFVLLEPGDSIRIDRCQPHQIIALKDSDLIEFSTIHEESDSYRIQKGD